MICRVAGRRIEAGHAMTLPAEIIDAHHHLWDLGRFPYPWLAPSAPPRPFGDHTAIKRNYLPHDYRADFAGLPLVASVHVQANCGAADPVDETRWLASMAQNTGLPTAVVGFADMTRADAPAVLAGHAAFAIAKGVRALVAWDSAGRWRFAQRPGVLTDPVFRQNAALLERLGLSLDLVIAPEQMPEVAALAQDLPGLAIILNHLGTAETAQFDLWKAGLRQLAAHQNIAIKLSGLWTIDKAWSPAALRPFLAEALEQIGAARLMYGSNAPVEKVNCPVSTHVPILAGLIDALDPNALPAIFADTARRLYQLPPNQ